MTQVDSVRTTVVVDLDPDEAFEVFTAEIDTWYRRGAAVLASGRPGGGLRFEPAVGGRVLRTEAAAAASANTTADRSGSADAVAGSEVETEVGRITGWEPGKRLCFVDQRDTEVEVWFEPDGDATRVVLEHRGLGRLPEADAASLAQYGWRRLPLWFEDHVDHLQERT